MPAEAVAVAPTPVPPAVPDAAPAATRASAHAAYEAKQYATCAEQFTSIAASAEGDARVDSLYNAACCHALGGQPDLAFAALERAVASGLRSPASIEKDADFASLHADPRWAATLTEIRAKEAAWEKSLGAPALRRELLALVEEDQAARQAWIGARGNPAEAKRTAAAMAAIDKKSSRFLERAIDEHGWPGKSLVGEDGAHAAWLLVQHADAKLPLQKRALALMTEMLERGEVSAKDVAYLTDRVAVAEKRPQRYGTQFKDGAPQPIEDEANVDERRKAVGLGTMAEYKRQMEAMYGPAPAPVPAPAAPAPAPPGK